MSLSPVLGCESFQKSTQKGLETIQPPSRRYMEGPGLPGGARGECRITFLALAIILIVTGVIFSLLFGGAFGHQFIVAGQVCGIIFLGLTFFMGGVYLIRVGCRG